MCRLTGFPHHAEFIKPSPILVNFPSTTNFINHNELFIFQHLINSAIIPNSVFQKLGQVSTQRFPSNSFDISRQPLQFLHDTSSDFSVQRSQILLGAFQHLEAIHAVTTPAAWPHHPVTGRVPRVPQPPCFSVIFCEHLHAKPDLHPDRRTFPEVYFQQTTRSLAGVLLSSFEIPFVP